MTKADEICGLIVSGYYIMAQKLWDEAYKTGDAPIELFLAVAERWMRVGEVHFAREVFNKLPKKFESNPWTSFVLEELEYLEDVLSLGFDAYPEDTPLRYRASLPEDTLPAVHLGSPLKEWYAGKNLHGDYGFELPDFPVPLQLRVFEDGKATSWLKNVTEEEWTSMTDMDPKTTPEHIFVGWYEDGHHLLVHRKFLVEERHVFVESHPAASLEQGDWALLPYWGSYVPGRVESTREVTGQNFVVVDYRVQDAGRLLENHPSSENNHQTCITTPQVYRILDTQEASRPFLGDRVLYGQTKFLMQFRGDSSEKEI